MVNNVDKKVTVLIHCSLIRSSICSITQLLMRLLTFPLKQMFAPNQIAAPTKGIVCLIVSTTANSNFKLALTSTLLLTKQS